MTPRENTDMWIKFANLCRKAGRMGLAEKTLNSLLGDQDGASGVSVVSNFIQFHLYYI